MKALSKKQAEEILLHLTESRGMGSTQAAIQGLRGNSSRPLLLVDSRGRAMELQQQGVPAVGLDILRGIEPCPLVLDNEVVAGLCLAAMGITEEEWLTNHADLMRKHYEPHWVR